MKIEPRVVRVANDTLFVAALLLVLCPRTSQGGRFFSFLLRLILFREHSGGNGGFVGPRGMLGEGGQLACLPPHGEYACVIVSGPSASSRGLRR